MSDMKLMKYQRRINMMPLVFLKALRKKGQTLMDHTGWLSLACHFKAIIDHVQDIS